MTKIEEIKAKIIAGIEKYLINHRKELSKEE